MAKSAWTKKMGGARANAHGKSVEKALETMNVEYRLSRRAIIAKLNVPTNLKPGRELPDGKREWVRVQAGKAPIDQAGTLPQGEAIFLEIKSTGDRRASLPLNRSKDHERHQLEELAARHRLGAHALVLWWNEDRLGILVGAEIDAAERADATNVPAEKFLWMEPMRFDWLAHYLEHGRSSAPRF